MSRGNGRASYRSGELARLLGVSADTLRHYERVGVLPRPRRAGNGYREYDAAALERVRVVRAALSIGFTLEELAGLLRARERLNPPCRQVRELAGRKLEQLETRLVEMSAAREELVAILRDWDRRLAASGRRPAHLLESLRRAAVVRRSSRPSGDFPRALRGRKK